MVEPVSIDFEHIDHPLGSAAVYDGVERTIGGWVFRLRPVGDRNRFYLAFKATHAIAPGDPGAAYEHLVPCLLGCVLMGWREARDAHGTPIPYSPENARQVLEANPSLAYEIFSEAMMAGKQLDDDMHEEAEALGNSPDGGPSSDPTSNSSNGQRAPDAKSKPSRASRNLTTVTN